MSSSSKFHIWLLFYSKTWQKQPFPLGGTVDNLSFHKPHYAKVMLLQHLKIVGFELWLHCCFYFFKVLVNISLFLQGVSGKLGEVVFLLHISATKHYYVHPKVTGAAMEALLVRWFPRPVSAEQTPSNGSVINAESHSITCTQLSCRSEPDKA